MMRADPPSTKYLSSRKRDRARPIAGFFGFLTALLCATTVRAAELHKSGEFKGSWTAVGSAQTLVLDETRSATILRLQGNITTESSAGLTPDLQSDCVGLNLKQAQRIGVGRCVWIDTDGDRMISEISGVLTGTVSKLRGLFIGGTGKYAGLEGDYELEWQYLSAIEEEGTINGYSTSLTGNWRLP